MKITRRQLIEMIQDNIGESSLINEGIGADTYEKLESALEKAYLDGRRSYRSDQIVIGIPGKTEDRPVDPNPHYEVVNSLVRLVKEIVEAQTYDEEPDLDYRDIVDARKALPDGATFEDLANSLGVSVPRLQEIMDDINQGYEDRYIEDQDWHDDEDDDDYPKTVGYTDAEGKKQMIQVQTRDDMDDLLDLLDAQEIAYSID